MKLKQYEEIAVLEEGDDGAVVTVTGQRGASVLLLCAEMRTLLKTHHEACNKFFGVDSEKTLAVAFEELKELRKQIDGL